MANNKTMNKFLFFLSFFAVFTCASYGQELAYLGEPSFKIGEELSYKLKYGFFTAAETTIKVLESDRKFEGNPAFHIVADAKTAGTFDIFYKVRNRYETYVDEKTLEPYFYTENRKEASYKHSDNVTFDHTTEKIKADKGVFQMKGKTFDFLSAYYFARSIDISKIRVGEKFKLDYFLEDGVHSMEITYSGKEKMDCALGNFNCLKFSPTIIPGRVFRKSSKLYLWITDDANRIPVKAHVELIVGSLTMELTSAKNLKYPLNPLKK